jgi:signal transduction histidine kinase
MGLMISKMIVEKYGGEIRFISKLKKGSKFSFTFYLEENDEPDMNYESEFGHSIQPKQK